MNELLWLLLPVAAASGWLAARRSPRKTESSGSDHTPAYFRGLNYLLNEQTDKAIDVFVEMLEVDNDTVETHLALGNLFRRRGEVDRAIRIHQNLIARPTLSRDHRAQALLELGQDYMRAGLFDRAESLFRELTEMGVYQREALHNLLMIYQREKDWDECLKVARRLEQMADQSLQVEMAHFYCELAEEALRDNDRAQANLMLRKAHGCDDHCVRATLLQGKIQIDQGECRDAIRTLKRIEQQDAAYITEALPPMTECYQRTGDRREQIDYLKRLLDGPHGIAAALALVELLRTDEGEAQALEFLTDFLLRHPDLAGLDRLIALNLKGADDAASDTLRILQQLVGELLNERPAYQCNRCGFSARTLHWHCPSCLAWSSIKPLLGSGDDKPVLSGAGKTG